MFNSLKMEGCYISPDFVGYIARFTIKSIKQRQKRFTIVSDFIKLF